MLKSVALRIILIVFAGSSFCGFGQNNDASLKSKIDSLVLAHMKKEDAVGVSIGIVKDNKIWYLKGYGSKELHKMNPVDSITNFHLASISKVFVTTAIMQLAEQGKIDINKKLVDYIPSEKIVDPRIKQVTIKQILIHTSGIPDADNYHWDKPKTDSLALKDYSLKHIQSEKLLFDPDTDWAYSNMAFEFMAYLIERVSKESFEHYETTHIFNKLGMNYSDFDYYKINTARRSVPHVRKGKEVIVSKVYPYNREHSGSGTLNSCTYDMCKWMIEMFSIDHDKTGTYQGLLKHETLEDMWSPKYLSDTQNIFMGLGWFGSYTPLGTRIWHSGRDTGYSSQLYMYPEQQMGIILLVNGDYPSTKLTDRIPSEISQLLLNK